MLLLLDRREFRPYWFETGSPNFLSRTLEANSVSAMELEGRMADMALVSKFDVEDISAEAQLFQTGYLTITEEAMEGHRIFYRLDYPNLEVRLSLNDALLDHFDKAGRGRLERGRSLKSLLEENDFEGFESRLRAWFSSIPYQWHAHGELARYEAWQASLLHMCLRAVEVEVRAEEVSSQVEPVWSC